MCLPIDADRFRFHVHEDFEVNVGLRETLVTGKLLNDIVGHIKLLNGHSLIHRLVLNRAEIANRRRIMIHLQTKE
ncbi:hypothetical protein YC2023_004606 [Brassica napus]